MTRVPRNRARIRTATALTTAFLTLLGAGSLHHAGHLRWLLLVLAAALGAITATLALASAFAPTTATRTAARHTLDLLLRLVPWYTPRG
ncbi:hypothetical protein E6R60_10780 [Streptomyces sp. A0642]|uniref:hypothetical protein n=1 Tax=Streptomyces sp. A0642 TaxID=2563100 RepID=UPI0010A24DCA|nr:hypothetical protein [Streptomyces sp. A0642]THA77050.1 hypothetical protein E6R60_10780 [Streptomyces sp. A0642]